MVASDARTGAVDGGSIRITRLCLADFRCFAELDLGLGPGVSVVEGGNGQGKTSLLEAIAWVARTRSFRGVPDAALVRSGCTAAVLRAEIAIQERVRLFEAEIRATGRNRLLVDRRPVSRHRDLHGVLHVTVFSPDDLDLVKGPPAVRRLYLDDLLTSVAARYAAARSDFERVLRQRNALLRSGLREREDKDTLEVFDEQLVRAGGELVRGRLRLVERLTPALCKAYAGLSRAAGSVGASYETEWAEGPLDSSRSDDVEDLLRVAVTAGRRRESERGLTLVGPHRDEWRLEITGLDARTQASQGEQRSLALALRLAGHAIVTDLVGAPPVLLLDDVFSELDPQRCDALVHKLPPTQTLLTTAGGIPPGIEAERRLRVTGGRVEGAG